MKNIIIRNMITSLLAVCIVELTPLVAQGAIMVSNLDQTPTGSSGIGSDLWIAQSFNIDANDPNLYMLDAIQLLLNPATGNPNGLEVSIFSAPSDISPQDYLGSLSGPSDTSTGGIYTYTASEITLSGEGFYFVVVTSSTSTNQGAFNWSASDSFTQNGTWAIRSVYYDSSDGSSWDRNMRENVFQLGIYATVVPEPSTILLLSLGLFSFWCRWRRLHS